MFCPGKRFFAQCMTMIFKGVHCVRLLCILQYLAAVFFVVALNVKNCLLILLTYLCFLYLGEYVV